LTSQVDGYCVSYNTTLHRLMLEPIHVRCKHFTAHDQGRAVGLIFKGLQCKATIYVIDVDEAYSDRNAKPGPRCRANLPRESPSVYCQVRSQALRHPSHWNLSYFFSLRPPSSCRSLVLLLVDLHHSRVQLGIWVLG
jgi:hypothetical protein